jgi:hypothetical protein
MAFIKEGCSRGVRCSEMNDEPQLTHQHSSKTASSAAVYDVERDLTKDGTRRKLEGRGRGTETPQPHPLTLPITMSSQKALNAILPQIAAGKAYEAHQKARTFAARYQKSGQYDVAIDVLFQSARELLKAGQAGSGTDLAGFLLEVYEAKGEKVSDESRGTSARTRRVRRDVLSATRTQVASRNLSHLRARRGTGGRSSSTNPSRK